MAKETVVNSPRSKFKPGTVLNQKYELEAFAGKGGMGEVWKAHDRLGTRHIALKFITTDKKRLETDFRQMRETFRVAGELNHQNICPSYGLEFDRKYGLYLLMKWIDGSPLNDVVAYNKKRLRNKGLRPKFPRRVIPEILEQIAAALDFSHSKNVIHRDVKPSNVFLEIKKGKLAGVYLIDFGLASFISRESRESNGFEKCGTMLYMAPEQWKGARQNGKTDQYSLAVIAYELYSGAPPFVATNPGTLKYQVLYDVPQPIRDIPEELNLVIAKGLSKEMNDRYDSCSEFVHELERAAEKIAYDEDDDETLYPPPVQRYVDETDEETDGDDYDYLDGIKPPTFSDKMTKAVVEVKRTVFGSVGKTVAAALSVAVLLVSAYAFVRILIKMIQLLHGMQ